MSLADPRNTISPADDGKPVTIVQPAGDARDPAVVPVPPFGEDCLYKLLDSLIASRLGFANGRTATRRSPPSAGRECSRYEPSWTLPFTRQSA
jgi:hypothetical protein